MTKKIQVMKNILRRYVTSEKWIKKSRSKIVLPTLQLILYLSYRIAGRNRVHSLLNAVEYEKAKPEYKRIVLKISSGDDEYEKFLGHEIQEIEDLIEQKGSIKEKISLLESYRRNLYLRSIDNLKIVLTIFLFFSFIVPFSSIFVFLLLFKSAELFLSLFILFYPVLLSIILRAINVEDKLIVK